MEEKQRELEEEKIVTAEQSVTTHGHTHSTHTHTHGTHMAHTHTHGTRTHTLIRDFKVFPFTLCRLKTQEETAKQLESEKREISDVAQDLKANLEVHNIHTLATVQLILVVCVHSMYQKRSRNCVYMYVPMFPATVCPFVHQLNCTVVDTHY